MNKASIDILSFAYSYGLRVEKENETPFIVLLEADKLQDQLEENLKKYDIKQLTIFNHKMLKKGFTIHSKDIELILK